MVELNPDHLLATLCTAARSLTSGQTVRDRESTLIEVARAAVTTIPYARGAGISRAEPGAAVSAHAYATSDDIGELDRLQRHLGEGPGITAADDPPVSGIVLADDLDGADRARWPSFAPAVVRAGYHSMLSVGLFQNGGRCAALTLYAHEPSVFDETAQLIAGLFGAQAGILLHGADHSGQLVEGLATRDVIGQAKGILAERFAVTGEQAFQMLVRASQDTNVKLVNVARWLTQESARAARPGRIASRLAPHQARSEHTTARAGEFTRPPPPPSRTGPPDRSPAPVSHTR